MIIRTIRINSIERDDVLKGLSAVTGRGSGKRRGPPACSPVAEADAAVLDIDAHAARALADEAEPSGLIRALG